MKKNICLLLLFIILTSCLKDKVFALNLENDFIDNGNGIIVSSKEYNFINEFYGSDYFENMTYADYEWISDLNIDANEVEISSYFDYGSVQTYSSSHSTANKKITIAKSCTTVYCTIITNVTWFSNPKVRSYDVIGARFKDTSLYGSTIDTRLTSSAGTQTSQNSKKLSNGFGVSIKLPENATGISLQQKFSVNIGGNVFVSYQHATTNISLSNSKLFSISSSGLGSVFNFYGAAQGVYDGMQGVYI